MKKLLIGLLLLNATLILSCDDPNADEFKEVNSWIRDSMADNYLWNERVPDAVNGSIPPGAFFGSMLDPNDYFSYIVDDASFIEGEIEEGLSSGISPAFGQFTGSSGAFIVVQFVYPGSPADSAGLERGDIILEIDNILLDRSNASGIFYSDRATAAYTLGEYNPIDNSITNTNVSVEVSKVSDQFNPVIYSSVIEQSGSKIGYLNYAEFSTGSNNEFIDSVSLELQELKMQGISDLIIDLRYNVGGELSAAINLANSLVPSSAAQNEEIFVEFRYNDKIEQDIIDTEGGDSENLVTRFSIDPNNLELQRVYFLTTNQTSSTSELLINGLIPHMDVNVVGEATSGQFYGIETIFGLDATPSNEYVILPVNFIHQNSQGNTGLNSGILPSINVDESLLNTIPIGNTNDPILKAAIDNITTGSKIISKHQDKNYEIIPNRTALMKGLILLSTKEDNPIK